jgi:hypothetical protein
LNSDYIYFIKGKVLIIEDSDLGNRSVTNDIQNVLTAIHNDLDFLPETIIYKDSLGNFDGVMHEQGKFIKFYSVNESDLEKALEKVRL